MSLSCYSCNLPFFFLFCYCNTSTGYCHCLFSRWKSQVERSFLTLFFIFQFRKLNHYPSNKNHNSKVSSARQQHFYLHPSFFFQPSLLSQNFTHAHTSFSNLNYTISFPPTFWKLICTLDIYLKTNSITIIKQKIQTKNKHTTIRQQTNYTYKYINSKTKKRNKTRTLYIFVHNTCSANKSFSSCMFHLYNFSYFTIIRKFWFFIVVQYTLANVG